MEQLIKRQPANVELASVMVEKYNSQSNLFVLIIWPQWWSLKDGHLDGSILQILDITIFHSYQIKQIEKDCQIWKTTKLATQNVCMKHT